MSDPRKNIDNILDIFKYVCNYLNEKKFIKDLTNINDGDIQLITNTFYNYMVIKYKIIKKDDKMNKEYLFDLIIRILKGESFNSKYKPIAPLYTINDFINEPFFQLTNKALKQYTKLMNQSPKIASKILQNASDKNIYKNKEDEKLILGDLKITTLIQTYIKNSNRPYFNFLIFEHITIFEVDLHTVCRLLKKPEKKNSMNNNISSLSVIYLGNDHIKNIKLLFTDLYEIKFENSSNDGKLNNDNENIKCIDISII